MVTPIHIDSGIAGHHVLISAGVHGDEYEPMLATRVLIKKLPKLLKTGSVTIVPVVNISAAAADSRYGADGLDLARICPGNKEGTASEQSAAHISDLIKKADFYIDLHTGGRIFQIFPLAGYMLHASKEVLEKQQMMARAFNLPVIWGTDAAPNGRTLSVARDAHIPAIYVEYGGGNVVKKPIIKAYTEGCLHVLRQLNMGEKKDVKEKLMHWIEDYTPNNGHLQVKMPAPTEGVFTTKVQLGKRVTKGQLWGTITDIFKGEETNVYADEDGIVLFLRDAAYVKKGDSLGGLLPINDNKHIVK